MSDCEQTELSETSSDTADIVRDFIGTYETLPELWDPTNVAYKNKIRRNVAYDKLLVIFKKLKPGATRVDVKRKINTLRCNYRRELKKISISKRSGCSANQVYQPTSWVFYALQFLGKDEEPENSHDQGDEISSEERVQDEELCKRAPLASALVAPRSSTLPRPQKKRRAIIGPLARQSKLLHRACSFLEQARGPQDTMPTIAKVWGEKLVALDPQQRAFAEKAVNDVLFEASQGTLHRYSVRINEDPRFEAMPLQPPDNNSQSHLSISSGKFFIKLPKQE